ncbi:MAG: hypothetical protein RLZ12_77 [Bacillota bacterium]
MLVKQASNLNMPALALTDKNVLYGVIPFYEACLKAKIKPIIGCEVTVSLTPRDPAANLILLAANKQGYQHLLHLSSIASSKLSVSLTELKKYTDGLIAIALPSSENNPTLCWLQKFRKIFSQKNLFVALQNHGLAKEATLNQKIIKLANDLGLALVATNHVHYLLPEEKELHDTITAILHRTKFKEDNPSRLPNNEYYLKSEQEMAELFSNFPAAIYNTTKISERCQLKLALDKQDHLPCLYKNKDEAYTKLKKLCEAGLAKLYNETNTSAKMRLTAELKIIDNLGFTNYFLIVHDLVKYADKQDIAVGPGRGSAVGSLVAYLLGITEVDPLKHNLIFERFLNPERTKPPDIDLDFAYEHREEIVKYIAEKYGHEHVAQITTFGHFTLRSALRDLERVFAYPNEVINNLLHHASQNEVTTCSALKTDPNLQRLFALALKLIGLPRVITKHATGVIISRKPLNKFLPLQKKEGGLALIQYPLPILEKLGLIKFDIMGMKTLSLIKKTVSLLPKDKKPPTAYQAIQNDPATLFLLANGDTTGIFQMESRGMRNLLRKVQPKNFEELIAVLALYRPGPKEQIPLFIRSKHLQLKPHYLHPHLKPILEPTHGIIIYQEQILEIAHHMANLSYGTADILRRAITKRHEEKLKIYKQLFIKGCITNGYSYELSEELYKFILTFASYGFPRCHATAYGLLTYQTAYLKANFPLYFFTSLLNTALNEEHKLELYLQEAKAKKLTLLPPDIQFSELKFTIEREKIRSGLLMIKNISPEALDELLRWHTQNRSGDFFNLLKHAQATQTLSTPNLKVLIEAGALDSLKPYAKEAKLQLLMQESLLCKAKKTSAIYIRISKANDKPAILQKLKETLQNHHGTQRIYLYFEVPKKLINLSAKYRIAQTAQCINEIEKLLGCPSVFIK